MQPHVAKSVDWRFGSMLWFVRSLCRAAFQANCAPSSKWSLSPPPLLAAFLFYLFFGPDQASRTTLELLSFAVLGLTKLCKVYFAYGLMGFVC